jgi:hypothetical protein
MALFFRMVFPGSRFPAPVFLDLVSRIPFFRIPFSWIPFPGSRFSGHPDQAGRYDNVLSSTLQPKGNRR